jgi:hypothetical protein
MNQLLIEGPETSSLPSLSSSAAFSELPEDDIEYSSAPFVLLGQFTFARFCVYIISVAA